METVGDTYLFRAYGLNVRSEIEFPELPTVGGDGADIRIIAGQATGGTPTPSAANAWRFGMDRFRLRLAGVADYEVSHGDHITVHRAPGADPAQVRIHLLTICLAAALMQRGRLLLHASGIVHRGGALLFAGDSGAGKSSLAAALRQRGHRFLTDDTCAIDISPGPAAIPVAHPAYPMLKLTGDTIDTLGDPRYDRRRRIWPDSDKYGQPLTGEPLPEAIPVTGIFILDAPGPDSPTASCQRLSGIEAFLHLTRHTYRKEFIHESRLQQAHLHTMGRLAHAVPVRLAHRPTGMGLAAFCDQMEQWMETG